MDEQRLMAEALEELARTLRSVIALRERDWLPGLEHARHQWRVLGKREDIARRFAGGEGEVERVSALVEVDRAYRGLQETDDRFGEEPRDVDELGPFGDREPDAVQLEKPPRQRRGAFVEVRALEGDRRLVRDRGEELEIAVVVCARPAALSGDRADHEVALPERRDDDRVLLDRAPGREFGETKPPPVVLDITKKQRPALDGRTDKGACTWPLDRRELLPAIHEEAVSHGRPVRSERRHEEVVRVHDRGNLPVHVPEDLVRVKRTADRVADLDERGQKARAALGNESRADVEVAEKEERDSGKEEPWLHEDDLDRDDRRETPEELRASGAVDPSHGLPAHLLGPEHQL